MTELALLWHMHQPVYLDPETGVAILPWVRLHAARSYYDMARVLERHPGAKVHVNLVPGLLDQIEAAAGGRSRDVFLDLTLKPAVDLTPSERESVLRNFFMVDWDTEVGPLPRYRELLEQRGRDLRRVDLGRAARETSAADLRDLQVLFNLAWTGFALREEDTALRELRAKGRDFSERDKLAVTDAHARALAAVVPLYRKLQEAGQIELTATPYYHPILPLLIDSDSAREALPGWPMPERFQAPDDAREQVRRARESHLQRFGRAPAGMWPAEGSVSPAAAAVFAAAETRWIATDEGVLFRSLPAGAPRAALHQPYRFSTEAGDLAMVFRDRGLSDLVGFTYQKLPAADAVADFFGHLAAIGSVANGSETPLVSVILDGENAWEHYPDSGREFLNRLYEALAAHQRDVTPVLLSERFAGKPPTAILPRLHSGSWIEASFRIWIGHREDRAAWEALLAARRVWEAALARGGHSEALAQAHEHLLIAEGSDWFWWFGDDFVTDTAAEFDSLFRRRLLAVYRLLGVEPPDALNNPISGAARREGARDDGSRAPDALIKPTLDGRVTSYGEWIGAGLVPAAPTRGSMHQSDPPFSTLRYGFDLWWLFLRLDPGGPAPGADTLEIRLEGQRGSQCVQLPIRRGAALEGQFHGESGAVGEAVFVDILEVQLRFDQVGLKTGDRFGLFVRALSGEVEVQRFPATGRLELEVPGPDFEHVHWKV